ncbi:MAG: ATP-dependent DNA ligase [Thermoprotei archaeon]|nr:MAG: ATP-dependent DNA ligase [Thermoprotei archaeon]RLF20193.1 MAG: ATP-dependent DNA ligase [Thermoprotei archaeon]
MLYSELVEAYEKIERTTRRTEMTAFLVSLLKKVPPDIIDKVIYLTQGKLRPDYEGLEYGMGEKLVMRAIALAAGCSLKEVEETVRKVGDLGSAAEILLKTRKKGVSLFDFMEQVEAEKELTVERVYSTLMKIAKATGEGAQDTKVTLLASLLRDAKPKEAKYLIRTILGRLRLGIADMTILDALAIAFGKGKGSRELIERAYNRYPDLGYIAKVLMSEGLEGVKKVGIKVGVPIMPMLAERLRSPEEILQKLGGVCIAEYKYDGMRIQAHKKGNEVILFSRRLENVTSFFPDACDLIRKHIKANEAIVEGECVAIDPDTGELRPFQELMHRRRKYDIRRAMEEYPVSLFMFDVIYVDGKDLTLTPYPERRKILESILEEGDRIKLAQWKLVRSPKELEEFFEQAIADGCEGVMCKSLMPNAIYQSGTRGFLWIKYKRDYKAELADTLDLVAVGAFWGKGRRAGTYGALLMAAYDPETDTFKTVCKVGSGFTDEQLAQLPKMFEPYVIDHKHPRVDSKMEADVWFVPAIVMEITGAEITLSPIHTCAWNVVKEGAGLAIRFPRFIRFRPDKSPEEATTVKEVIDLYKKQRKITAR